MFAAKTGRPAAVIAVVQVVVFHCLIVWGAGNADLSVPGILLLSIDTLVAIHAFVGNAFLLTFWRHRFTNSSLSGLLLNLAAALGAGAITALSLLQPLDSLGEIVVAVFFIYAIYYVIESFVFGIFAAILS